MRDAQPVPPGVPQPVRTRAAAVGASEAMVARPSHQALPRLPMGNAERVLVVGDPGRLPRRAALRLGLDLEPAAAADAAAIVTSSPPAALVVGSGIGPIERKRLLAALDAVEERARPVLLELGAPGGGGELARADWPALAARLRTALEVRSLAAEVARKDGELRQMQGRLDELVAGMSEELRLAGSVQRSLLPAPEDYAGLDVAREFLPFREVGGDYYDFLPLGRGQLALALGDVMGKGIPAALLAAGLKAAVRAQLQSEPLPPEEVVFRVNRLFREIAPPSLFASLFFGVFDVEAGTLDYVNAGHDYPFLLRGDGSVDDLVRGGTVLGLMEGARYERGQASLTAGDLLIFFSDGVTDRSDVVGEAYGIERLKEAAARSRGDGARLVLYSILGDVQGFSGGVPAQDDTTLIVVRVR